MQPSQRPNVSIGGPLGARASQVPTGHSETIENLFSLAVVCVAHSETHRHVLLDIVEVVRDPRM